MPLSWRWAHGWGQKALRALQFSGAHFFRQYPLVHPQSSSIDSFFFQPGKLGATKCVDRPLSSSLVVALCRAPASICDGVWRLKQFQIIQADEVSGRCLRLSPAIFALDGRSAAKVQLLPPAFILISPSFGCSWGARDDGVEGLCKRAGGSQTKPVRITSNCAFTLRQTGTV